MNCICTIGKVSTSEAAVCFYWHQKGTRGTAADKAGIVRFGLLKLFYRKYVSNGTVQWIMRRKHIYVEYCTVLYTAMLTQETD